MIIDYWRMDLVTTINVRKTLFWRIFQTRSSLVGQLFCRLVILFSCSFSRQKTNYCEVLLNV